MDGDQLEFRFDTRRLVDRATNRKQGKGTYRIQVNPVSPETRIRVLNHQSKPATKDPILSSFKQVEGGYDCEVQLPIKLLNDSQNGNWQNYQAAVVIRDVDEDGQQPSRVLWRGSRDIEKSNLGYGYFVRQ